MEGEGMICRKNVCILLMAIFFYSSLASEPSFSQDGSAGDLARLTDERNKVVEADRNASSFVQQYSSIVTGFEQDAKALQNAVTSLESEVKTRMDEMSEMTQTINSKLAIVINPASSSADISRITENYRQIRKQKNPCDDVATIDAYAEMLNRSTKMHAWQSALTSLASDRVFPAEHAPILAAARKGLLIITSAVKQADTAVLGYKDSMAMPKVCELFQSFDTILALASVAAEANETAAAIDKLDINQFLKSIDDANSANQAVTSARRMMSSIEGFFISGVRLGYLNRTQRFMDSYRDILDGLIKNIVQSSLIGDQDKSELKAKADQTKVNIQQEINKSNLRLIDGRRNLLLTRGRNLYASIGKAQKDMTLPATDAQRKEMIDFCKNSLNMTFPGRYLVPLTPTIEAEFDLDSNFEKAQELLAKMGAK
jgi:hypothetical protein